MPLSLYASVFGASWYGTPTNTGTPGNPTTITPPAFGTYIPGASTTGYTPGTEFTQRSGDLISTSNGDVIENLDIDGYIYLRAQGQTVRNCVVRGSGPIGGKSNIGMIDCQNANCFGAQIYSVTLLPNLSCVSTGLTGILGHDYTARYVDVSGTVDGFGANSGPDKTHANVTLEGCYAHGLAYLSPDANHPDDHTHNDGFQVQYGGNFRVVGNNLQCLINPAVSNAPSPYAPAGTGQAVSWTPNVSNIINALYDSNLFGGGAQPVTAIATYNANGTVHYNEQNITLTNNRISRNGHFSYGIRISPDAISGFPGMRTTSGLDTTNGNVWDDTGLPVLVSIS